MLANQGLDEHAVATVMKQVLLAVSYLHDTAPPVIHRDIKVTTLHLNNLILCPHCILPLSRCELARIDVNVHSRNPGIQHNWPRKSSSDVQGRAHQAAVLQASNILIDAANGRFVLADLGVAAIQQKCFEADAKALCPLRPFLQRFSYVGSPSWMAPEVMEQSELQG